LQEAHSQGERLVWLSSLFVKHGELALIEEDARADFLRGMI
jgi:hypothetical protein